MVSKAKVLLLALVAICAFGAVSAAGASAAEFHIAGMGTATADGTQISGSPATFSIPEVEIQCPQAIFNAQQLTNSSSGEVETTGQTATVKVEEGGTQTLACTFAGLSGSIVHMNECELKIHTGPPTQVTVRCPNGQQITVTAIVLGTTKCTIHIPEQSDLQGISAANNASDLDLTAAVTGIHYQSTTGSGVGACTNTTSGIDGKFNGKVTVQGTAGGVASKIQYS